jgi:hypothetical protein
MPDTTTDKPASDVVMQFLTRGGATVQVTKEHRTTFWDKANPTGTEARYPIHCLGCDYGDDNWSSVVYARSDANQHATDCRAMPKPTP